MRLSPEQHALIIAMRRDANRLREIADSDGQNDLGAALQDAAWALGTADAVLAGRAPGQMDGKLCDAQYGPRK